MRAKSICTLAAGMLILGWVQRVYAQPQMAVSTSAAAGFTAANLADEISDASSQYTVDPLSASFAIKNSSFPTDSTDLRAIGTFSGGNTPTGTSLGDPVDPTAVFSGGVGITTGVCLSTGYLADNEPTAPQPPIVPPQLAVGVQGPNNGYPTDPPDPMVYPDHEGEVSKEFRTMGVVDEDFAAVHACHPI